MDGLEAHPKDLQALADLPFPSTLRAMQSFLGSLNYYSRFIEDLAIYASVLYELRESDFHEITGKKPKESVVEKANRDDREEAPAGEDRWTRAERSAEDEDRCYPSAATLRSRSTPSGGGHASKWAVSAALMQEHDGVYWHVTFTSRTLKSNEINYGVIVKCTKGEDEILGTLAATITPRAKVDEALIEIAPQKQPRQVIAMPPPTVEPEEKLLVVSFGGSARVKRGDAIAHVAAVTRSAWRQRVSPDVPQEEIVQRTRCERILQAQNEERLIVDLKVKGEVGNLSSDEAKNCAKLADDYEVDALDLLFYCPTTAQSDEDRDLVARLVAPETLQQDFIHHYHTRIEGGHQGIGRTYHRIRAHFHWRVLYRSVQRYVGECIDCETGKGRPVAQGESPGNLQATYPFQMIAMDHIPPLPKSFMGNTELLIWVDLFSGYLIAKASSSRTAQTVAENYEECVFRRGPLWPIRDRADHHNERVRPHKIEVGTQVWLYLDRVKEGYARKLAHLWHGPFRVLQLVGDHAARLETAGTECRLFPIVHLAKLKPVRQFPDRPGTTLTVDEAGRFDFDEALLPGDSWEMPLGEDEFDLDRIADMRAGRRTRYGRVHREFLVYWKGYENPSWVDEADLNCGALMREYERRLVNRNRFHVMQSQEGDEE
ncbi:unnamed protein product [Phytophthora fragariaefolia]|uniref:Unnamed protein product n=1 Tax=Phytophthora fragariaefolia TaxID=1490495 RepID=A0A9W6Y063_9STRA|nr:unnamed protein product [Phytophthora fragariaefolia]